MWKSCFFLCVCPDFSPWLNSFLVYIVVVFVHALPSASCVPPLHLITPRYLVDLSFWLSLCWPCTIQIMLSAIPFQFVAVFSFLTLRTVCDFTFTCVLIGLTPVF